MRTTPATEVLGPEQIAAIGNYLFVPDDIPERADIAVVLGMTRWRRPLECALALYRRGVVSRLLLTGGYNHRIQAVEAWEMAGLARAEGVPAEHLIVDPNASNTLENAINAAHHMQDVSSAVLVAIHYHARRARLTARKVFPSRVTLGLATYPSLFYTSDDWHLSERGRRDAFSELSKLRRHHATDYETLESRMDSTNDHHG